MKNWWILGKIQQDLTPSKLKKKKCFFRSVFLIYTFLETSWEHETKTGFSIMLFPKWGKKNWLQTTANEIVIMVLIHLPNSKNLSNLIKSEFCPLFNLSLLVFLVSKIENLCCSVELPCVSYHWELSSIKISKISFFEFLDIFHQNQPKCTLWRTILSRC